MEPSQQHSALIDTVTSLKKTQTGGLKQGTYSYNGAKKYLDSWIVQVVPLKKMRRL